MPEVHGLLFVGDYLHEVDYIGVLELPQDLYLTNGRDREAFLLIFQAHLFQRHHFT